MDGWVGDGLLDHLSGPLSTGARGFPFFIGIESVCQSRTTILWLETAFFSPIGAPNPLQRLNPRCGGGFTVSEHLNLAILTSLGFMALPGPLIHNPVAAKADREEESGPGVAATNLT